MTLEYYMTYNMGDELNNYIGNRVTCQTLSHNTLLRFKIYFANNLAICPIKHSRNGYNNSSHSSISWPIEKLYLNKLSYFYH